MQLRGGWRSLRFTLALGLALSVSAQAAEPTPAEATAPAEPVPEIALAAANAAAVREPSSADAWGGARSGDEAPLSDRVVSYVIQTSLAPDPHTMQGQQHLTWRNSTAPLACSVYHHLSLNALEGQGRLFFTNPSA